jgi:biotin transporter BioY
MAKPKALDPETGNTIVIGSLAVLALIGALVLLALNMPVPAELWSVITALIGFFVGQKYGAASVRARLLADEKFGKIGGE